MENAAAPVSANEGGWRTLCTLVVFIAAILGLGFVWLMPPFQFNDEHAHFARSYQISRGEFAGHPDPQLPAGVLETLLRYPEGFPRNSAPRTSFADLTEGGSGDSTPLRPATNIRSLRFFSHGILAYQLYWSVCYMPASAGIRVVRFLNLSPVSMLYAARSANLLVFLAALATALLLAPGYRALITAVALMPMTLQQAVAVSADQVTIAFSLTGLALILRTREHSVSRRYLAAIFAVMPWWVLCKNSLWALPLLLLIPGSQFASRRRRYMFLAGAVLATMAAVVLWQGLTSKALAQFTAADLLPGVDFRANARLLAAHPVAILKELLLSPGRGVSIPNLIHQFIGTFGWEFHQVPFSFAYLEMLVAVACIEAGSRPFRATERAILVLVFVAALIQTFAMLFVIDGTWRHGHYGFMSAGVQGRYLIPFCLAGLLALRQTAITVPSRVLVPVILCLSTPYALFALLSVDRFFYR